MKKEFNFPIIETRQLSTESSVMTNAMLISANSNASKKLFKINVINEDTDLAVEYKMWKYRQK